MIEGQMLHSGWTDATFICDCDSQFTTLHFLGLLLLWIDIY